MHPQGTGYAAAAACKASGVHRLNLDTGKCEACGEELLQLKGTLVIREVAARPGRKKRSQT